MIGLLYVCICREKIRFVEVKLHGSLINKLIATYTWSDTDCIFSYEQEDNYLTLSYYFVLFHFHTEELSVVRGYGFLFPLRLRALKMIPDEGTGWEVMVEL